MALGWMLLALVGAEPATVEPTHEAVCGLKNLFTAEFAHLGERDRYEPSLERIGFRPLPCPDATRPAVSGENSAGGCRFVFTVTQAGNSREALRAEAVGVGPGVQGMRFVLDAQARITRTDSRQPVVEPDCEAWRRAADPLWRYHDAVAEHDCVSGPYAAEHPCAVALADLAAQARAGVGVAQKEYAAHPTAKELVPLEPPTPAMTLCGLLASKEDRARAIAPLEQDGTLVATLLGPRCHPDGLSVALPRVLRRLEAVCPEESCLKLLALARDVRLPDLDTLIQSHAATLAEAIIRPQPQDYRSERISVVMGLTQTQASVFTEAVEALNAWMAAGLGVVFVTNNASRAPEELAARLTEDGVDVSDFVIRPEFEVGTEPENDTHTPKTWHQQRIDAAKALVTVGLTGGIAAGRTEVGAELERLGAVVVEFDDLMGEILVPGSPVLEELRSVFGEDIVRADGTLDARTLNRLTTESSTARTRMYEIVAPAVRDEANRRAREIGEDSVLVVDLALLAETGSGQDFDQVLAVSAPAEVRVARLMESHDMTRERAWAFIDEEAADEERAEIADTVIENDGSLEDLQEAVRAYWEAKIQPQLEAARGERV